MSRPFARNFAFNVAGSLLPVVSALVTVPLYLALIGPARYGIVSITWILLGYFGFLDFGLSRASANALGKLGHAPPETRAPVFATALFLNIGLGAVAGITMYLAGNLFLRHVFTIPADLRQETLAAFPWMVPMLPLGMVLGVASGALDSREFFLLSNMLNAGGTVLGQALPLLCAYVYGPSLAVLIPSLLLARLLVVLAIFAVVVWVEWPMRPFRFELVWARRLFGYGAWVSVSSLISPVLDTIDQMLIGRFLGAVAIAHYAVPMNLAMRSQVLATALARTLFPRMSREDEAAGRKLAQHATVSLIYGFGALCGPAVIVAGPFLAVWVGRDFAAYARPVAEILMVGAWMNGVAYIPYNQLQAQGRPDLTARVHAIEIIPFVLGLWALIVVAGLPGAALAWTLRVGLDGLALLWLARCLDGSLLRASPAVGLMGLCVLFSQVLSLGLIPALMTGTVMGVAFLGIGIAVEPVLRQTAGAAIGAMLQILPGRLGSQALPP